MTGPDHPPTAAVAVATIRAWICPAMLDPDLKYTASWPAVSSVSSGDDFDAGENVSVVGGGGVLAAVAEERVDAAVNGEEGIVAGVAVNEVGARAAVEAVVAALARKRVVAGLSGEPVAGTAAEEAVVAIG